MPHRSCTGFVLFCYVRRCSTAGTYTWPGRAIRRQFRISVQQNSIGSVLHNLGLGNYHRTVSSVGLAVYHLSGYPLEVTKRSNAYKSTFINIWLYKSLLPPTLQCLATITKKSIHRLLLVEILLFAEEPTTNVYPCAHFLYRSWITIYAAAWHIACSQSNHNRYIPLRSDSGYS